MYFSFIVIKRLKCNRLELGVFNVKLILYYSET